MAERTCSPEAVARDLLELAERSRECRVPRTVDMSEAAVGRRLQTLGSLHRACLQLAAFGRAAGLHSG